MDWLTGRRLVEGDTSQGSDIYRFRFGPRATTLRNEEYYNHAWTGFTRYAFGEQIQDGGAVFGLSYHDLMARLKTLGPDNAWGRMREILHWYKEVQAEGGYRTYFEGHPERGLLQSPKPGGLGLDREFGESVLIPQFLLSGLAGYRPRMDGFSLNPALPSGMPSLTITRVRALGVLLDLTVARDRISLKGREGGPRSLTVHLPEGQWEVEGNEDSVRRRQPGIFHWAMKPGSEALFVRRSGQ